MMNLEAIQVALKYLLAAFVLRCLFVYSYRILLHPLHVYRGPFIAQFTDWYGAYHGFRKRLHYATYADHQKHGPVIRQGPNKLVFNSIGALHDIYLNDRLSKSKSYLVVQENPSVFTLFNMIDKRLYRSRKQVIAQSVNEKAMRQFEPILSAQVDVFLKQLLLASEANQNVDMSQRCSWLGLDISGELCFGHSFDLQTSDSNRWIPGTNLQLDHRMTTYMQFPELKFKWEKFLVPIFIPGVIRWYRTVRGLVVKHVKTAEHARPDLFSSMISDCKDPYNGKSMSILELMVEAFFLLPAGGVTTPSLMSACFFYLSCYPKSYQRLSEEIRSTFSTGSEINSGSKLAQCVFLHAFIQETLRISPPCGTTLWRDVPADADKDPVIIDGHIVPSGTKVGVNIYSIHHNEAYFSEPLVHEPTRWIREESKASDDEYKMMHSAFNPFSIGARSCAAKSMVYLEASLTIARTLWYFDFERAGDEAIGARDGMDRVFHMDDIFGARHTGPLLRLRPRGEVCKDLSD